MLYQQSIKNLVSGISQQTATQRYPEQLEEQVNGLSTESAGLQKRPPTVFIKRLMSAVPANVHPLIHFIDRDEKEKYIVMLFNNTIKIFDFNGVEHAVKIQEDVDYLKTDKPHDDLRISTVADYTFITNRNKTVKMATTKSPDSFNTQGALVHVIQGQYGRTYKIWVDGAEVASHSTPDGSDKTHTAQIDTNFIADKLAEQVRAKGYTVDKTGDSWLRIRNKSGVIKNVATADGFNNQAMRGFTKVVQRFNLLPATAPDGYTVKVKTDPNGDDSGSFYVKYNSTEKVWEECCQPNLLLNYEASTMPHSLIRQSDGSFIFKRVSWVERKVGDDDSNPYPSFVDSTINDIFFYRNRLGFLSGENIILSESAEYFNFWMTTASDILDIDPIDVTTTTSRINILNYAIPFNSELYCFSDKSQFVLRSDTTLSPRNTALVEITSFQSSPDCKPVCAGIKMYFPAARSEYTSIKEYYSVQDTSDEKNAQDITSHVPNYIPNGVYQIEASNNENILLFLTTGKANYLYVYKYLFMQEQRVQSAWSYWDMQTRILGVYFIGSTLYLILNRGNSCTLEKMNFTTSASEDFTGKEKYRIYMDCKKIATTATYDDINEITTFNLATEYAIAKTDISNIAIVLSDGTYQKFSKDDIKDGKISVLGNHTKGLAILGIPYRFYIKLSPIYIHQQDSNGSSISLLNGRLQLRYLFLNYADTGDFTVYVSDKKDNSKNHYEYQMTARILGMQSSKIGSLPSEAGVFKVPIQKLNTNTDIYITSVSTYPVSLINFSFEGTWVERSRRV